MKKAILVGAGGMGRAWAKNLTERMQTYGDVQIAAWLDVREGIAAQAAAELSINVPYFGTDLQTAIHETASDFVIDVTTPEAHHGVTLLALAAGLPVLGEKPMADSMEHAREMVTAAERAGKLYMVSQSRRYHPQLAALRSLIVEQIGLLGILNANFYLDPHFGGFRDLMDSPLILDMAIHTFDAARYLSAADPVSVYCDEFNPAWSWYAGNAAATAIFELSNGLRFTYCGAWCAPGQRTSWEAEWRAVGSTGTATWDGQNPPQAEVVNRAGDSTNFPETVQPIAATVDMTLPTGISGSLGDFLTALDKNTIPMGECHDNIKSLAMVFAAIQSARSGQRVPVQL